MNVDVGLAAGAAPPNGEADAAGGANAPPKPDAVAVPKVDDLPGVPNVGEGAAAVELKPPKAGAAEGAAAGLAPPKEKAGDAADWALNAGDAADWPPKAGADWAPKAGVVD